MDIYDYIFISVSTLSIILHSLIIFRLLQTSILRIQRSNRLLLNINVSYLFSEVVYLSSHSTVGDTNKNEAQMTMFLILIMNQLSLCVDRYIIIKDSKLYYSLSRYINFLMMSFGWFFGMVVLTISLITKTNAYKNKYMHAIVVLAFILSQLLLIFSFWTLILHRQKFKNRIMHKSNRNHITNINHTTNINTHTTNNKNHANNINNHTTNTNNNIHTTSSNTNGATNNKHLLTIKNHTTTNINTHTTNNKNHANNINNHTTNTNNNIHTTSSNTNGATNNKHLLTIKNHTTTNINTHTTNNKYHANNSNNHITNSNITTKKKNNLDKNDKSRNNNNFKHLYNDEFQTPICLVAIVVFTTLWLPWQLCNIVSIILNTKLSNLLVISSSGLTRLNTIVYPIIMMRYHNGLTQTICVWIPSCHCEFV